MHPLHHLPHHLDRTGRSGHDPGPEGRKVETLEIRVAELGDEHGGHAVERGAALLLDRRQRRLRIEAGRRINHRGTAGDRGQVAHHHAKAVVEGNRHADPVSRPQSLGPTDEPAVVQDIAVRQRGALRRSCRPAGELDIDRVTTVERGADLADPIDLRRRPRRRQIIERDPALTRRAADPDPVFQLGGIGGIDHGDVVAGLEPIGGHHGLHPHLVQGELELGGPVGRVDGGQDQTEPRGRELGQGPFGAIGRPDPDAVSAFEAQGQKTRRHGVRLQGELAPAPPDALGDRHHRVGVTPARGRQIEGPADRKVEQRWLHVAFDPAQPGVHVACRRQPSRAGLQL